MAVKAIADHLICINGQFGDSMTESGIVIKSTANKAEGIGARWFQVHSKGDRCNLAAEPGQWVLVEHGRWSNDFKVDDQKYWRVDPLGCMAMRDDEPENVIYYDPSKSW